MKEKNIWKGIFWLDRQILGLLYPPRCPVCDQVIWPKQRICHACRKKIHAVLEPACMKCGKPLSDSRKEFCYDCRQKKHFFEQGKALWVYDQEIKRSIYRFKYQNRREYGRTYASEMAEQFGCWIRSRKIQAIIPVPLHKNRQRQRGYNQAEILALELGRILGLPVYNDILIRIKDTKPQKILNDAERKNNLKKAFKTTEDIVQLQCVLVVDDIYTTGSTLDAAACVLAKAGVKEINICCISIGKDG